MGTQALLRGKLNGGAREVYALNLLHDLLQRLRGVEAHQVVLLDDGAQLLLDGLRGRASTAASLNQTISSGKRLCEG